MTKKRKLPKKKQSRPVPEDAPRKPGRMPKTDPAVALAIAADEMHTRAARRARGAKHIAEDKNLPAAERRKAAALLAKTEYATDPDQRPLQWHYEREDRPYAELWASFKRFDALAAREGWKHTRDEYWEEIQRAVQKRIQRADVEALLNETRRLSTSMDALLEYIEPMRDEDGIVLRHGAFLPDGVTPHPYAGRAILPLEMTSIDKFIPAMLKVYDKLQQNRSVISGRPILPDDTSAAAAANDDKIDVPQHVIQELTRGLLAASATMGDFTIEDLPDNETVSDQEIDDDFQEFGPSPTPAATRDGRNP